MMMNNFKGYDTFSEQENDLLRAWNRAETIANINKAKGLDVAQAYFDTFDEEEKMKIKILMLAVSSHGRTAVYKKVQECIDGTEFVDGES